MMTLGVKKVGSWRDRLPKALQIKTHEAGEMIQTSRRHGYNRKGQDEFSKFVLDNSKKCFEMAEMDKYFSNEDKLSWIGLLGLKLFDLLSV